MFNLNSAAKKQITERIHERFPTVRQMELTTIHALERQSEVSALQQLLVSFLRSLRSRCKLQASSINQGNMLFNIIKELLCLLIITCRLQAHCFNSLIIGNIKWIYCKHEFQKNSNNSQIFNRSRD